MARAEPQLASELAMQPSPVLLEAVLKVDHVVSRLQNLQSTISGIHLSPVNPKYTRSASANTIARSRTLSSDKDTSGPALSREERRRRSLKYQSVDCKAAQPESSSKSKDWRQWSSSANQVHDVISEILVASEFAKQIATLVSEALQDSPKKKPGSAADQVQEPLKKDAKRRDKAMKTMSARAPESVSKIKSGSESLRRRRVSRAHSSCSSSPRSPLLLLSSPSRRVRESDDDADDELAEPRRLSMNVTEIRGALKPWKLTPTKGVLFSNPVYLESSPPRPSPVQIVPTTGRRRSSQRRCSLEHDRKLRSSASFKREAPTKAPEVASGLRKRDQLAKKVAPPSRYVEMVPLDGPQDTSFVAMLDVLRARSPSRLPMSKLDANHDSMKTDAVTNRREQVVQCRVSRSHARATPDVKTARQADKENTPLPSCAPNAAKFLRSMSSGHSLNRTSSRKSSAVSLLQRAKGWVSAQVTRQGRVRELER